MGICQCPMFFLLTCELSFVLSFFLVNAQIILFGVNAACCHAPFLYFNQEMASVLFVFLVMTFSFFCLAKTLFSNLFLVK